jgi:hypothetical protein
MWMKSYLNDRTQRVAVGSVVSNAMHLQCGVPQSSVLGPRLYCIFAKPIGEICRRFRRKRDNILKILSHGVSCKYNISYVLFWFNLNIVELIHTLTSDKQVSRRLLSSGLITRYISVHSSVIMLHYACKNKQVQLQSYYFQIRNIGRNRSYTTEDACKTLVCSLITSHLRGGSRISS